MDKKAFFTIDSGGSKTVLTLYTDGGTFIKEDRARGFGSAEDGDAVLEEARQVISAFCEGYKIARGVCNLGGKNKTQMEATLKAACPHAEVRVFRESEGTVGLALCEMYSAQVTLMAGTGAIAIAPTGEKTAIVGGWGANISDRGSGYQLGLDAVRLALRELDGTGELSLLTQELTGIKEPPDAMDAADYCAFRDRVRRTLAPLDRAHIASFARTVYDTAKRGDGQSLALYKSVGLDLATLVITAAQKARVTLRGVVVNGGMVNGKEFWMEGFEEALKTEYGAVRVHYLTNGIDDAMRHMANKITKGE